MISSLIKFIKLLGSDIEPQQISLGIALGLVMGLSPLISIQVLIGVILFMLLRVNFTILMMSYGLFSLFAYIADPVLINVGQQVLTNDALKSIFTDMYNNGFWRVLNFNNTVAMGSLIVGLILFLPVYIITKILITKYRSKIEKLFNDSAFFRFLFNSKIVAKTVSIGEKLD